ncbi:MAG: heavy metal-binding domain-containing protein, partial [Bacteroidota bacterium]|nr:heavy metal-binding domain-containing protein [Bacteroidota bacterium]
MENQTVCPNCNESIKTGWSSNRLLDARYTSFINYVFNKKQSTYCDKCGKKLLDDAKTALDKETAKYLRFLEQNISYVRIITTHVPYNWQYESISIVTGQSVTGTGAISEFKTGFSDFFGGQSGSFNKKLSNGEQLCFSQLRAKAINLGGNAIIGTDIDYGDVGEGKGMLMVCAAGTAIKIINTDILGDDSKIIDQMCVMSKKLIEIDKAQESI